MAITNNGLKNGLPSSQLPTGYTVPTVTDVDDPTWTDSRSYSVAKSTVEDADPIVTMENIVTAIEALIDADLANDFVATNTVTSHSVLRTLTSNQTPETNSSNWLDTTAETYTSTVTIYVEIA